MNIEKLTTASTFISDFGKDSTSLDIREGPVLHNTEEIKYEDSGVTQLITEDIACTNVLNIARGLFAFFVELLTHLILRGAEQVVPSSVQGESSDACIVSTHHLDTVAPGDGPHTDGVVWRCREDHGLEGETQQGCKGWEEERCVRITDHTEHTCGHRTGLWRTTGVVDVCIQANVTCDGW